MANGHTTLPDTEFPGYDTVPLPSGKPKADFETYERRRYVLERIREAGHPELINKSDLADELSVARITIYRDFDALAEWIGDNLGRDHEFIMDEVFHTTIRELMDEGEFVEAARIGKWWFEWLADMGVIEKVPDKHAFAGTITVDDLTTDAYTVIPDDEAAAIEVANEAAAIPDPEGVEPATNDEGGQEGGENGEE